MIERMRIIVHTPHTASEQPYFLAVDRSGTRTPLMTTYTHGDSELKILDRVLSAQLGYLQRIDAVRFNVWKKKDMKDRVVLLDRWVGVETLDQEYRGVFDADWRPYSDNLFTSRDDMEALMELRRMIRPFPSHMPSVQES